MVAGVGCGTSNDINSFALLMMVSVRLFTTPACMQLLANRKT